jgi:hypothetical protein
MRTFLAPSRSQPGTYHKVVEQHDGRFICSCEAAGFGRECRHIRDARAKAARRETQNDRVLRFLDENPGATSVEISRETCCLKYTSRVSDLRKLGFVIDCVRGADSFEHYFLRRSRVEQSSLVNAPVRPFRERAPDLGRAPLCGSQLGLWL